MFRIPLFILIAVLAVLAAGGWFLSQCEDDWCFVFEWQKIQAADSFERCVSLGFPIMKLYPAQCIAGDKIFMENVPMPQIR